METIERKMLIPRLLILIITLSYVSADAEPAQQTYIRNKAPRWLSFDCDEKIDCPPMQRRQRNHYSEICMANRPNWLRLHWEEETESFDQIKAQAFGAKVLIFIKKFNFFDRFFKANRENMIDKTKAIPLLWYHAGHKEDKTYFDVFIKLPKLEKGKHEIPCDERMKNKGFGVYETCEQFRQRFVTVSKAPCFYALEDGADSAKLQTEIGWEKDEIVKVGTGALKAKEWHLAPNNLMPNEDDE